MKERPGENYPVVAIVDSRLPIDVLPDVDGEKESIRILPCRNGSKSRVSLLRSSGGQPFSNPKMGLCLSRGLIRPAGARKARSAGAYDPCKPKEDDHLAKVRQPVAHLSARVPHGASRCAEPV